MGVLNALQTKRANLRERRENRRLSQKGDIFLSDEKEILEHVIRFPESCSRKFSFQGHVGRQYPLFPLVCRPKVSLEVIQAVHEAYPQAIPGALHCALRGKQTSLPIIQYLLNHTPDRSFSRDHGSLPLHTALAHQAKLNIVKFLVEEYPEGVQEREPNSHRLPLHIAIEHFASLSVIKLLVSKYKDALKKADYDIVSIVEQEGWLIHKGNYFHDLKYGLPLHVACKRRASLQVIHFLVSEYPNAVATKNRAGWLPLHFACAYGAQPIVLEYLITCCPDALLEKTNFVMTEYPTHLAAGKPDADLDSIKLLVANHPQQNEKPNSGIYTSYMDDASHNEAHPIIIRFLRSVVCAAAEGYTYVPTQEERFRATEREEQSAQNDENAGAKEAELETSILLGQFFSGS